MYLSGPFMPRLRSWKEKKGAKLYEKETKLYEKEAKLYEKEAKPPMQIRQYVI